MKVVDEASLSRVEGGILLIRLARVTERRKQVALITLTSPTLRLSPRTDEAFPQ